MPKTPPEYSGASGQRRAHRKSRNGCQQCKSKKIKCDERKPSCSHCRRAQSTCSFSGTLTPSSSASDVRAEPSTSPQLVDVNDNLISRLNISEGFSATNHISTEVKNLELLHFYTTTTSLTLSNRPELQQLWQSAVPRIAFTHDFLLHGILAFAALHLSHSQPNRKDSLYTEASAHHEIGLRMFRIAMSNITPQNSDACLAFSTIIAAYAWASSNQSGDLFFSDKSTSAENVEWASLLRGVHTLLQAAGEWLPNSSLKMILHPRPTDLELAEAADLEVSTKLSALRQLWDPSIGTFNDIEMKALDEALALLHEDCELVFSSPDDRLIDIVSIVYAWPIKVPRDFLAMVKELIPEALVVLAYYSLLLNKADKIWYMRGMSRHLLQTIHGKVGKKWESWIAWPLQKLVLNEFKD